MGFLKISGGFDLENEIQIAAGQCKKAVKASDGVRLKEESNTRVAFEELGHR
jgi:hypothetical protein